MAEDFDQLYVDGAYYETRLNKKYKRRKPWRPADPSRLSAFIPGVVRKVHVRPGERVEAGQILLTLEAMKMQNPVEAQQPGTVRALFVKAGEQVAKGQVLLEFE